MDLLVLSEILKSIKSSYFRLSLNSASGRWLNDSRLLNVFEFKQCSSKVVFGIDQVNE